jgi:hypothetical protein
MKKHFIAVAVAAAVAVPAMAQNVTIGGVLDISPHSDRKITQGTATHKNTGSGNEAIFGQSASNRINITMTEDLGGGLKVDGLYRLRYTNVGGSGGADDVSLRLTGSFGAIRFGRFSGFVDNLGGETGAFAHANTAGSINSALSDLVTGTLTDESVGITVNTGALAKTATGAGDLADTQGLIQYASPVINGFQVVLDYANRSQDDSGTGGTAKVKQHGVGFSYTAGPLKVSGALAAKELIGVIGTSEATGSAAKTDITWLGANYDLGAAKVFVTTASREDKSTASAKTDDVTVNTIGIQVPMGALTLFASMYDGEDKNTGVAGAASTEKRSLKGNQIAARYTLSKRTYAYVVSGVNKDTGATANTMFKNKQTAIGLAHTF